jgi:hypothetical protein
MIVSACWNLAKTLQKYAKTLQKYANMLKVCKYGKKCKYMQEKVKDSNCGWPVWPGHTSGSSGMAPPFLHYFYETNLKVSVLYEFL